MMEDYKKLFVPAELKEAWLSENPEYNEMPANFVEFCLSDEYLNLGGDVYKMVLDIGIEIYDKNSLEVVILAGIGGGKSFLAQLLLCHMAHRILCLRDPHSYFLLTKDKPIVIMNMGLSATQAKKVVFSGVKNLIAGCRWFGKHLEKNSILSTSIIFRRKVRPDTTRKFEVLEMISGNSTEEAPIGMNLIGVVLDEAAFYLNNDNTDQAQLIYDSCKARITSRFGDRAGMIIVISSPKYEKDFISMKLAEGLEYPDVVFSVSIPTWKMKNREVMSDDVFVFDKNALQIIPVEEYSEKSIFIGEKEKYDLCFGNEEMDRSYWIIPTDFHDTFRRQPEKSIRDIGAMPTAAIDGFIKLTSFIDQAMGQCRNRVLDSGDWDYSEPPSEPVFVHMDLALNKKKKNGKTGDAAGIAVCHCVGFDTQNENRPIIKFDFVERILAGAGGEIKFSDVRAKVIGLIENGWNIGKVTIDGWQSRDTIQILNARGVLCEYQSVDTTPEPYETVKDGLYDMRLLLPEHDHLKTELKELEFVAGGKVDHPVFGSKDVADAVAGATFVCTKNTGIRSNVEVTQIRIGRGKSRNFR